MKISAVIFLVSVCFLNRKAFISDGSLVFVALCIAAILFSGDRRKESR